MFICPSCGDTPSYLVGDGEKMGITKRKVKDMTELQPHQNDKQILAQATTFQERTFIEKRKERKSICRFLQHQNDIEHLKGNLTSDNGKLVFDLAIRLHSQLPSDTEELPKAYKTFIANVSKETSSAGY